MPQLDIALYIPQLFWLAIFFLILLLGMYWVINPRLVKIFNNRTLKIDAKLKEIQQLKNEADFIYEKAKNLQHHLQNEIKTVLQNAKDEVARDILASKDKNQHMLNQELSEIDRSLMSDEKHILNLLKEKEALFVEIILKKLLSR